MNLQRKFSPMFLLSLALVLGIASWIGPSIVIPGNDEVQLPLLPPMKTHNGLAGTITLICLAVSGWILGQLDPVNGLFWGAATGIPIVTFSTLEVALGQTPHSLFGIELVVYVGYTFLAILGAWAGIQMRKKGVDAFSHFLD